MLVKQPKAQRIPPLFAEIIKNDELLRLTKASPVIAFSDFKQLHAAQRDQRRMAEKIYAGTKNKGKEI
jgi:hypothetical protein